MSNLNLFTETEQAIDMFDQKAEEKKVVEISPATSAYLQLEKALYNHEEELGQANCKYCGAPTTFYPYAKDSICSECFEWQNNCKHDQSTICAVCAEVPII